MPATVATPPPAIVGEVACDACPRGPVYVIAYPATDRYNWPWWDVYGFLRFLHDGPALDRMRPAPIGQVTLDAPGSFRLELDRSEPVYLFALLDVDRDGPERGPSAVDRVGRFPRNPIAPGGEPIHIQLYPQTWREDFEAVRWRPSGSGGLRFRDGTEAAGLEMRHCQGGDPGHLPVVVGAGALLEDLDGDGALDLVAVQGLGKCPGATATTQLWLNDGAGGFRDASDGLGLEARTNGMGVLGADADSDGDIDLLLTAYGSSRLLRNDGAARFTDVTATAGIADPGQWPVGASFGDVDGDGRLDLYVANYVTFSGAPPFTPDAEIPTFLSAMLSSPFAFPGQPNRLYLGREGLTFERRADAFGASDPEGKGMAAVLVDLDRDGALDLFVSNDCTRDRVFHHRGDRWVEVATADVGDLSSGMGIAVGDIDGDGALDLFSPHWLNEPPVLYANRSTAGGLRLTEVTFAAGLAATGNGHTGWASEFVDFDRDGDLDLLVTGGHTHPGAAAPGAGGAGLETQPPQLFVNDGRGRFEDASCALVDALPTAAVWRGAASGDVDGDGDVDLYLVAWNGRGRLLLNDSDPRHWLTVGLRRAGGERGAIGARVELTDAGGRVQSRQVVSGTSYLSHSSLELEFGLGAVDRFEQILVTWPGGRRERFGGGPSDRVIELVEGAGQASSALR